MSKQTRITVLLEVTAKIPGGDTLCLQQALYNYGDGTKDVMFRFIRRDPNGNMKSQRGQAGIPNLAVITKLVTRMGGVYLKKLTDI